jgi:hypothetical protein
MKILRTSRNNECPICGTHKPKCGWNAENPDFRFCMLTHDGASAPPGWRFLGITNNGLWGKFALDTQRLFSEEERTAHKQRSFEIDLKRRSNHAKSLSETERHYQNSRLIEQLSLHPHHREDLKRRGLSDELIRAGQFCSVDRFQKLDFEVSHNLAGVDISGRSLTNYVVGYMVPIRNEYFQIIGHQIRNDDSGEDAAKYLWLTSKSNKRRSKEATSHLQNGELPLTFSVPEWLRRTIGDHSNLSNNSFESAEPLHSLANTIEMNPSAKKLASCINLAEGILKAWILSQLRDLIVIGAAGGNFAASPELLKRYIEAASALLGSIKEVVLWADAGAIANKHIMRQYRNVHSLLKKWGYTVRIAWWGQIDKNCLDPDEYTGEYELLTWAQFEGMSRHPNQFWDGIKHELGKIKNFLRREPATVNLFDQLPKKQKTLAYIPGLLPTYGEYHAMGCPKIIYKGNERVTIWREALLKGWSFTLDTSATGLGKSHTVGSLTASCMSVKQLMYLASDHRNPTTVTIEKNYVDVFPRHSGLVEDPTRLTPGNRPFLVHPTDKTSSDVNRIPSNCSRHDVFVEARGKNLDLESSNNIICQGCPLLHKCRMEIGDGYGYLYLRKISLQHSQIRMHPDSAPLPENYNYDQTCLVWDETSALMRNMKDIEVRISDLHQSIGHYTTATDFEQFICDSPIAVAYKALHELFALKQDALPRYGLNNHDILARLGAAPDNIGEAIQYLVENLTPNLDFLAELADTIDTSKLSQSDRKGVGKFNAFLASGHNKEAKEKLKLLLLNWLLPMLEVWGGYVSGNFSFNKGVFTIHRGDLRHRDLARAAAHNIFLDATMPVENLSLKLNVPAHHILQIETEKPDYSNLEVKQVTGIGGLGRDRRESQQIKVDAARDGIFKIEQDKANNPDVKIGVIERKAFAREGDGYHFRDGRGINRFSDVKALIGIGAPYANIGSSSAEYQLLMQDRRKRTKPANCMRFQLNLLCNLPCMGVVSLVRSEQDYIDGLVDAEILQEIGRLRSHLRLEESLTYYFVGDYNLSNVISQLPGVKYTRLEAVEISPMCAGGEQRATLMVMNAISNLLSCGVFAPKQREVEAELKEKCPAIAVNQARISQLMKQLGGWSATVNLIRNMLAAVAIEGKKPSTDNSFEDSEWIINNFLPLIVDVAVSDPVTAVKELLDVAIAYGWTKFKEFIASLEYGLQQQLVELVLGVYALVDMPGLEALAADGA